VVTKKDKFLASAQKLLERGSLDKALAEFLKAAQEDQKDTRTWLRIAEIHVKRGESPQATQVYLKTAELYVEQGFFQRAVAVYKNVLKLTPGHTEAHFKLADVYKQLGLFSDAAQQYDHAATAFQRAGRLKEAISAIAQIVEMNPDQVMSRVRLAELAAQAGNNEEAAREFARAAEQLDEQGRGDDYLRVAERLLVIQPENFALARKVAVRLLERQNPRAALAKLQACYNADAQDAETLSLLANTFEQLGQNDKTLSSLRQLAKVYEDRRMVAERNQTVQRILQLDPNDPLGSGQRAERAAEERSGLSPRAAEVRRSARRETAITFSELDVPPTVMQQRMELPPSQDGAPDLSELEREQTQAEIRRILTETDLFVKYALNERAAEHVRKVFSLNPEHTGAHERLIAILVQLGRKAEAIEELGILADRMMVSDKPAAERHLRRALELDPHATGARRMLDRLEGEAGGEVSEEGPDLEESLELELAEPGTSDDNAPSGPILDPNGFDGFRVPDRDLVPVVAPASIAREWESSSGAGQEPIVFNPTPEPAAAEEFTDGYVPGLDLQLDDSEPLSSAAPPESEPLNLDERERPASDAFDEFEVDLEAVTPLPAGGAARRSTPAAPPPIVPAHTPLDDNVMAELEQVDFFLDQLLGDEARSLLDEISPELATHPEVLARRERLLALGDVAADAAPAVVVAPEDEITLGSLAGAVPGGSFDDMGRDGPRDTIIKPRAVVAAGADATTSRDLGIAYKEMGLYDAAVAEFAKLVDDPEHEVFALTMMGECYESRGAPAEALLHYKKALNRPGVRDEEATQLYYQLGRVFHTLGDESEALYFFEKVARRSPRHEDVAQRIQSLRAQGVAPVPGAGGGGEERARMDARGGNSNRR
jgi:pilus assembly protein FimV